MQRAAQLSRKLIKQPGPVGEREREFFAYDCTRKFQNPHVCTRGSVLSYLSCNACVCGEQECGQQSQLAKKPTFSQQPRLEPQKHPPDHNNVLAVSSGAHLIRQQLRPVVERYG